MLIEVVAFYVVWWIKVEQTCATCIFDYICKVQVVADAVAYFNSKKQAMKKNRPFYKYLQEAAIGDSGSLVS